LAEAIVKFFEDALAPRLRAGVERVRGAHSWEALANQTLSLGDELRPTRGWR
jgi:glycosyltransferase involved in cell wall biosynthesis